MAKDEVVEYKVRFEWDYIDKVQVKPSGSGFVVQTKKLGPGVYRLRGSRRGGTIDDEAWYVGQSIISARTRILRHVSEEFDPETGKGKKFRDLLSKEDGWVEIDMARNPSLDGNRGFIGVEKGKFVSAKKIKKLSEDDRRCVQFLLNLIESAGQVSNADFFGSQGRR